MDVAIVGAGITGMTAALLLAREGAKVAVVEADRVGRGATGYTTAKVTSQHGLVYDRLMSKLGREKAGAYGEANQAGLELVAGLVEELAIDCDFRRRDAFAYVLTEGQRPLVEQEAETAASLGLPADLVETTSLPYLVEAAVRFRSQAEFDPYKYLAGLVPALEQAGGKIYEGTRALGLERGRPCRLRTDGATVTADHVLIASHYPFLDRSLAFSRNFPERSYCLGVQIRGPHPKGMFISSEGPTRSVRSTPRPDGELLVVSGEGHKVGRDSDTSRRYSRLETWAREHFEVKGVEYRWSAQDSRTPDQVPFVGPLTPFSKHVYMASGYSKWGMTNGTAAGMIVADAILGRANPWAETFNPNRLRPRASALALVKENLGVGWHFLTDRLRARGGRSLDDLAPGEGGIVSHAGKKVAGYRDEDGKTMAVSTLCTHLYCQVAWNTAERSWDCPCHGSRFAPDGRVIEGPAVRDLDRKV